jgi:hypothetical protein
MKKMIDYLKIKLYMENIQIIFKSQEWIKEEAF